MILTYSKYTEIWDEVLMRLKKEINDNNTFNAFFNETKLFSIEEDAAIISTPYTLSCQILNSKFIDKINDCFCNVTQTNFKCVVKTEDSLTVAKEKISKSEENAAAKDFFPSNLNPKFTFDNYVSGSCNQECFTAAVTASIDPGSFYNPLFIYGKSGLGKTHLLHAIGNKIKVNKEDKLRVVFMTSDDFFEEYVRAIKDKGLELLKEKFRNIDVLLIDDIQFLANKDKTSETFFNVFNILISAGKQIVLTSDRSPFDLKGLEDRLVSRFASGLSVEIKKLDYQTALQILKKKIETQNINGGHISIDVLEYIAKNYSSDVRQLEGALNKLLFYSINFSNKTDIDIDVASETFKTYAPIKDKKNLNADLIKCAVSEYYHISQNQLSSKIRTSNIVVARHIAIYLCRSLLDLSLAQIGNEFGGRDHSTVISAYDKVDKMLKENSDYIQAIDDIKKILKIV